MASVSRSSWEKQFSDDLCTKPYLVVKNGFCSKIFRINFINFIKIYSIRVNFPSTFSHAYNCGQTANKMNIFCVLYRDCKHVNTNNLYTQTDDKHWDIKRTFLSKKTLFTVCTNEFIKHPYNNLSQRQPMKKTKGLRNSNPHIKVIKLYPFVTSENSKQQV